MPTADAGMSHRKREARLHKASKGVQDSADNHACFGLADFDKIRTREEFIFELEKMRRLVIGVLGAIERVTEHLEAHPPTTE